MVLSDEDPHGSGAEVTAEAELERKATATVLAALAVVRKHRKAEVAITLTSDRDGVIRVRQEARLPLEALVDWPAAQ